MLYERWRTDRARKSNEWLCAICFRATSGRSGSWPVDGKAEVPPRPVAYPSGIQADFVLDLLKAGVRVKWLPVGTWPVFARHSLDSPEWFISN